MPQARQGMLANLTVLERDQMFRILARRAGYDVQCLSALLKESPRQTSRYFKSQYGCSAVVCVKKWRMEAAAALLNDHQCIKQVAYEIGYSVPTNFSRDFRRVFSVTPSEFKKLAKTI